MNGYMPTHYPKDRSYQIERTEGRFNPKCQQNQKKEAESFK